MRKKKKAIHLSVIQPMLASVLMATSIPLVTLAATRSDADLGGDTPTFQNYEPKAGQTGLFDAVEFRKAHRTRYNTSASVPASSARSSVSSSLPPCAAPEASSTEDADSSVSSSAAMLRYDDLTSNEKNELRKQIRIGGCPYDVLPGYRELCELMLKQHQAIHPAAVLTPLRNPDQEEFNENR